MSTTHYYDRILSQIDDETVRDVYTQIRDSHGKQHAITKEMISLTLWQKYNQTTDRTVRECVETLHEKYAVPICSNSGRAGYYMPANRAELDEYLAEMRSRRNKIDVTLHKLEASARTWDFTEPLHHIPASVEATQLSLIPEQRVYA